MNERYVNGVIIKESESKSFVGQLRDAHVINNYTFECKNVDYEITKFTMSEKRSTHFLLLCINRKKLFCRKLLFPNVLKCPCFKLETKMEFGTVGVCNA